MGGSRRLARPTSPSALAKVRLSPLECAASKLVLPSEAEQKDSFLSSPIRRTPPVGRLGAVWGLRQSDPTPCFRDTAQSCEVTSQHRTSHDIRRRRIRRPADFGASMRSNCPSRSHSCSSVASTCLASSEAISRDARVGVETSKVEARPSASSRSCSTPPTGTSKADDVAATVAKARAVAALQRLFFEEMAKHGDANEAAARALVRLSEAPRAAQTSTSSSVTIEPAKVKSIMEVGEEREALDRSTSVASEEPVAEEEAPARQTCSTEDLALGDGISAFGSAMPFRPHCPAATSRRPLRKASA